VTTSLALVVANLTFVFPHPIGEGDLGVEFGSEDDLLPAKLPSHSLVTPEPLSRLA